MTAACDLPGPHTEPAEINVLRATVEAPQRPRLVEVALHLAEGCALCWEAVEQAERLRRPWLSTTDPMAEALRRISHSRTREHTRRRHLGFAFDVLEATSALVFHAAGHDGSAKKQLRRVSELVWHLEKTHPGEKATVDLRRRVALIRFTYSVFRDFSSFREKLGRALSIESRATLSAAEPGKVASALRASVALYANPLTNTAYVTWVSELGQLYQDHGQTVALRYLYRRVLKHGSQLRGTIEEHRIEGFSECLPVDLAEVSS